MIDEGDENVLVITGLDPETKERFLAKAKFMEVSKAQLIEFLFDCLSGVRKGKGYAHYQDASKKKVD